jgi:hypothetical protein
MLHIVHPLQFTNFLICGWIHPLNFQISHPQHQFLCEDRWHGWNVCALYLLGNYNTIIKLLDLWSISQCNPFVWITSWYPFSVDLLIFKSHALPTHGLHLKLANYHCHNFLYTIDPLQKDSDIYLSSIDLLVSLYSLSFQPDHGISRSLV